MTRAKWVLLGFVLLISVNAAHAQSTSVEASWPVALLAGAKTRIEALRADLQQAPAEAARLYQGTQKSLMSGPGVRGFTYLAILLFVGIGVEWLFWMYAYAPLRALRATPVSTPLQALRVGLRRLLLQGSGLLLFGVATIGASAAFAWPAGVHELVVASTLLLLVLRFSWIVVGIIVAPGRPQLQLVPFEPGRTRWLATCAIFVLCLVALGYFLPGILERALDARHLPGALRFAAASVAVLILFVAAFAFFGRPGRGTAAAAAVRMPLFPRSFVLALLAVAVYAAWILKPHAAAAAAILAIVIAVQLGLHDMVLFFWRSEDDRGAKAAEESALPAIALSIARFVVVLLGIGAFALALEAPVGTLAETVNPWVRVALRLLGVAVLALLAHGVWIAVRSVIDHRLAGVKPPDPHNPPDASSRLLTLLPVLRVVTAVLLLVMLVLSSLWALGIEITPLLAGAGVVGLAVGFGSQALVRDVISGIFYLAEDAFRVGEYIESGNTIKGTVERITLRSVALRHHNGPLFFVPYGSLGTVRNTSRDWVIDKFNLPLPIDVDSEKIRKMIKNIGEKMKEDTAIAQHIIEPLKGKLYRVDPGVKIFRCKFRSPPGKQFDIRAAALKRIEAALKEMGVGFADGKQTVLLQPGG